MKLTKIFALALAAAALTACSDDDKKWNSNGDVTVSMADLTVDAKEQQGMLRVPIKLDGEANGPVKITIEVQETGENPAINNFHMILTDDEINIPKGVKAVDAEFRIIDDLEYTGDRTFLVTITKVQGAEIGGNASTLVTILDNDNVMYNRLQGEWKVNYMYEGTPSSFTVNMTGFSEDEPGYEVLLNAEGWMGIEGLVMPFYYTFNDMTNSGYLSVNYGSELGTYESNGNTGVVVAAEPQWENGTLVGYNTNGSIKVEWDDDTRNLTFEEGKELLLLWRTDAGLYILAVLQSITMTR